MTCLNHTHLHHAFPPRFGGGAGKQSLGGRNLSDFVGGALSYSGLSTLLAEEEERLAHLTANDPTATSASGRSGGKGEKNRQLRVRELDDEILDEVKRGKTGDEDGQESDEDADSNAFVSKPLREFCFDGGCADCC